VPRDRTIVDDVDIVGTDAVDDDDIHEKIATEPTSTLLGMRLPWTARSLLDTHVLERDVRRVARYYRARGYYDARVISTEILPDGDEVDIRIAVEEGTPVLVRRLQVVGLETLPAALRRTVKSRVRLRGGEPFDEGLYDASKERILRQLRNEGYARSGVAGHVLVAADAHQADVTLTVRPGPICRLRNIRIRGLQSIRVSRVRVVLGLRRGEKFSDRALESAQSALFGLGVFQSVAVRPEVDPDQPYVDVDVELSEADFGRFRVGGGIAADRDRTSLHLTGAWEHRNLFGGLQRLTIANKPGLSISPSIFSPETLGFDNGVTVDFAWPGLPERETTFLHHGSYEAGLDTAANHCRHDARLSTGLARPLTKWLRGTVSHELQFYIPVGGQLVFSCPSIDGLPATYERAFLSYLSESLVVDVRDDPFNTRRGGYASLRVSETPPGLGADLGFVSVVGDARGYLAPLPWLGFAARALVGRAFPIPADRTLPSPLRFFGGGGSGIRGYDSRTIGHYSICSFDAPNCERINEGGDVLWELSLETRLRVIGVVWLVAFLDMGDVFLPIRDDPTLPDGERERLDLRRHHASIGAGLRIKTPIGPIRFDVAGRLPGLRRALETPGEQDFFGLFQAPVTLHFALGESF
jgi:outer membrane protein assembly factor BamA